jgi:6-phosphogluconolactonase (cycloisomerase 2 family)
MCSKTLFLSVLWFLVLPVVLAGCGGNTTIQGALPPAPVVPSASPTPTPTPTPALSSKASHFVFGIIDFEAEGFFGGVIDSASGKVTPAAGNPTADALGQNIVVQVLADPNGRFLYSLNVGASSFGIQIGKAGIGAYQINRSSGMLTPAPSQVIFSTLRSGFIALDGTGRFLYQLDTGGIDIYSIDQTNGRLTLMTGTASMPAVGNFSAGSADGRFLFNEGNGQVEVYGIDQASGQLTVAAGPVSTGGSGGPMAVSADSRFLYVANSGQGTVAVYSIGANGALTQAPGSPFATDAQAAGMSLSPDGKFLYITFQDNMTRESHVKGFAVDPAAGAFGAIAGATLNNATSVNVDGSGKFAYVSQGQLVTYKIDPATGALTAVSQTAQPVSDVPLDMALVP